MTFVSESKFAGSAGMINSTVRVSTAITPTGIPPNRARPVITVCAQPIEERILKMKLIFFKIYIFK